MAKSVRAMARASSPDASASVFGWPDGQMLADDVVLQGHTDLQLILLPFETSSQDQIRHLQQAAAYNNIPAIEQILQRPQDPDLEDADARVALHFACGPSMVP